MRAIDKDESGLVNKKELFAFLRSMFNPFMPDEVLQGLVDDLFSSMMKPKNGRISTEELMESGIINEWELAEQLTIVF